MWTILVVAVQPLVSQLAHLLERAKEIQVEYLGTIHPVETFDISILGGLTGLDEVLPDMMFLSPLHQRRRDELRPIVDANLLADTRASLPTARALAPRAAPARMYRSQLPVPRGCRRR